MPAIIFLFLLMLQSCSHYIFESETRLQIENLSESKIYALSLISEEGKLRTLILDTLSTGEKSSVYELQFVGEFDFIIYSDENPEPIPLGHHKLKGGSVYAQIKTLEGSFEFILK